MRQILSEYGFGGGYRPASSDPIAGSDKQPVDNQTHQLGEVSQLAQFFWQRNQLVVGGDQNLQREAADDGREDRQLVPAGGGQTDRETGQNQCSAASQTETKTSLTNKYVEEF